MTKARISGPLALAIVLGLATASTIGVWLAAHGSKTDRGWFPWALVAMGVGSLAAAVFQRDMKPDLTKRRFSMADGIMHMLGPTGSRFLFAVLGDCAFGGGLALLTG